MPENNGENTIETTTGPEVVWNQPAWFVQGAYLNNKVKECSLINFGDRSDWTNEEVLAALLAAGQTPYDNFVQFGNANNVSPSPYFVVPEYLASKAEQLNKLPYMDGIGWEGNTHWTPQQVLNAFTQAGISAWDHYTRFGQFEEGVNPSNQFDQGVFWQNKVVELNAWTNEDGTTGFGGKADWTVEDVQNYFRDHGLNAIMNLPDNSPEIQATLIREVPLANQVDPGNWEPWGNHVWPIAPDYTVVQMEPGKSPYNLGDGDTDLQGTWVGRNNGSTFQDTDKIDGGEGQDMVTLTMTGNFDAFKEGGYIHNVEAMTLINGSARVGRQAIKFNTQDVVGADTWHLNSEMGTFNLLNLQTSGQTFNVNKAPGDSTTTLQFAVPAISGPNDSITLGVNGVGSAEVKAGNQTTPARYANVIASGIETMNVVATGDNYLNLGDTASNIQTLNVSGEGDIHIRGVGSDVTTFNAQSARGDVNVNMTGARIASVQGGFGYDRVTIDTLAPNAVLDGGAGDNDSIAFRGSGAFAPTMTNFENLTFNPIADNLPQQNVSVDATNISGLNSIDVSGANVTMSNLDNLNSPFHVNDKGSPYGGNEIVLNGGSFDLDYQVTNSDSSDRTVIFNLPSNLTTNTTGDVTLSDSGKATFGGGTFNLYETESVTITNTNQFPADSGQQPVIQVLNAGNATDLTVTTAGAFAINGGSLVNVSNVELHANGASDKALIIAAPIGTSVDGNIDMEFSGTGGITLKGEIGGTNTDTVTIDASSTSGPIQVGDYQNVNVQGTPDGCLTGQFIKTNVFDYEGGSGNDNVRARLHGTGSEISTGLGDDIIEIGLANSTDSKVGNPAAILSGGLGNDDFYIGNTFFQPTKKFVQITDWNDGDDLYATGLVTKFATLDASAAKTLLTNFGFSGASNLDVAKDISIDALKGCFYVTANGNMNGAYFVNEDSVNATMLIQLVGVDSATELGSGTFGTLPNATP